MYICERGAGSIELIQTQLIVFRARALFCVAYSTYLVCRGIRYRSLNTTLYYSTHIHIDGHARPMRKRMASRDVSDA